MQVKNSNVSFQFQKRPGTYYAQEIEVACNVQNTMNHKNSLTPTTWRSQRHERPQPILEKEKKGKREFYDFDPDLTSKCPLR